MKNEYAYLYKFLIYLAQVWNYLINFYFHNNEVKFCSIVQFN